MITACSRGCRILSLAIVLAIAVCFAQDTSTTTEEVTDEESTSTTTTEDTTATTDNSTDDTNETNTSDTTTFDPSFTTIIPMNTTEAPNVTEPPEDTSRDTFHELDIHFHAFSESRVASYLSTLSSLAQIPVSRITMVKFAGRIALEFGPNYVFSVIIQPPTNTSGDTTSELIAAKRLEGAILVNGSDHPEVVKATMYRAIRVNPQFREREQITGGINILWVAFTLAGLFMIVASGVIIYRPRAMEVDAGREMDEIKIPAADTNENVLHMQALLDQAKTSAEARGKEEELKNMRPAAARGVPLVDIFEASLMYEPRLRLPPTRRTQVPAGSRRHSGDPDSTGQPLLSDVPQVPQILLNNESVELL